MVNPVVSSDHRGVLEMSASAPAFPGHIMHLAEELRNKGWNPNSFPLSRIENGRSFRDVTIKELDYKKVKEAVRHLLGQTEVENLEIAGVKVSKFFRNVAKILEATKKVQEERGSIVIGLTGSGKSSLINYLLGCSYVTKTPIHGIGAPWLEKTEGCNVEEQVPISHQVNSKTFLSEAYSDAHGQVFIDTPGFCETRGKEKEMATDIGFCELFRSGEKVKSIIVVIGCGAFREPRFSNLRKLCPNLKGISQDYNILKKSLLFVLTKPDFQEAKPKNIKQGIKEEILPRVGTVRNDQSISLIDDGSSEALHVVLQLIAEEGINNLCIVNSDQYMGDTLRENINDRIDGINLAEEEAQSISFRLPDQRERNLSSFVRECSRELDEFKLIHQIARNSVVTNKEIVQFEKEALESTKAKIILEEERVFDESSIRSLEQIDNEIAIKEREKVSNEKKQSELNEKIYVAENLWSLEDIKSNLEKFRNELNELDNEELVVNEGWENSCYEKRCQPDIKPSEWSLGRTDHLFEYHGCPYAEIEKSFPEGHTFEIMQNDKARGEFKARYSSSEGTDGYCVVYLKCKSNELYSDRIRYLKEITIPKLEGLASSKEYLLNLTSNTIENINTELVNLRQERKVVQTRTTIDDWKEAFAKEKEGRIFHLEQELETIGTRISVKEKELETDVSELKKIRENKFYSLLLKNEELVKRLSEIIPVSNDKTKK